MNNTSFAAPGVLTPLQGLWRWFRPATPPGKATPSSMTQQAHKFAGESGAGKAICLGNPLQNSAPNSLRRPLRIVRVLEAGQAPANVGRMLISGCMADVCAELDRLAAREAALH